MGVPGSGFCPYEEKALSIPLALKGAAGSFCVCALSVADPDPFFLGGGGAGFEKHLHE